jgi:hypothetical protein
MVERIPFTPDEDLLLARIFMKSGKNYEQTISISDGIICYQIGGH